jgi:hypothetical protein
MPTKSNRYQARIHVLGRYATLFLPLLTQDTLTRPNVKVAIWWLRPDMFRAASPADVFDIVEDFDG